MASNWRIQALVPGVTVAGVTLTALAATWLAPSEPAPAETAQVIRARPALRDGPADVVKAPPLAGLQPASCRGCDAVAVPTGRD
jgi:hypothetical protein